MKKKVTDAMERVETLKTDKIIEMDDVTEPEKS